MAYLVRRSPTRIEIRESQSTSKGPRSRVLASFPAALTADVIEVAAAKAARPFDGASLRSRARAMGIPVLERSREPEAHALLSRLRRRDPIDPVLLACLRRALAKLPESSIPESLEEVSEWIGASSAQRGAALRELLNLYGRIAESRPPPRGRPRQRFPRFSSTWKTEEACRNRR